MNVFSKIESIVSSYYPEATVFLGRKFMTDLLSNEVLELGVFVDIENRSDERINDKGTFIANENYLVYIMLKDSIDNNDAAKSVLIEQAKELGRYIAKRLYFDTELEFQSEVRFSQIAVLEQLSGYFVGSVLNITVPIAINITSCIPIPPN
jgi:hypothetical protein